MEDWEYNLIKKEVLRQLNIDLNAYKSQQMQRRLAAYLTRTGGGAWPQFFKNLEKDPAALKKFKDYLTINVSSFFRDEEKYKMLRQTILPDLLKQRRSLRIWSAGCSLGQEPYSIAILLRELTGPQTQHTIQATDLDQSALDIAKAGGPYPPDSLNGVPAALKTRYFKPQDRGFVVNDDIKRMVRFQQHNLLSSRFDRNFDLIICRNVVIYFTNEVKQTLYQRFYDSLRPGGILFVGSTEIVPQATEIGFASAGISFYRREDQKLVKHSSRILEGGRIR